MSKIEKVTKCYLCGSTDSEFYATVKSYFTEGTDLVDTFDLAKCNSCGFVYLSTRPAPDYLSEYYTDDNSSYYKKADIKIPSDFYVPDKNAKRVLDVGFGNCTALLKKYLAGWNCYGVDFSDVAVSKGKEFYPFLNLAQGTIQAAAHQDNFFDMVTLSHVLEHDYNPISMLKEIRRVLKPGGELVIDIPNFGGLYYTLFKEKAEYFVPHHLSFFDKKTLAMTIEKAGFTDYKIKNIFGNNTSYQILHTLGIQKTYYKKTVFNKFLGLCVWPIEIIFKKGDALRAFVKK